MPLLQACLVAHITLLEISCRGSIIQYCNHHYVPTPLLATRSERLRKANENDQEGDATIKDHRPANANTRKINVLQIASQEA